jgi:hypothetical protein
MLFSTTNLWVEQPYDSTDVPMETFITLHKCGESNGCESDQDLINSSCIEEFGSAYH